VHGAFTGANKTYDGTNTATITSRTVSGVIPGDDVSISDGTATFDSPNAGTGKTVTAAGLTLGGSDATNYDSLPGTLAATANITPKPLSVTAQNKSIVSGGSAPTFTASYAGFVTGQGPSDVAGTLAFQVRHPVTDAVVAVGPSTPAGQYNIVPSGVSSTNYAVTFINGLLTVSLRFDGFYKPVDMTASGGTRLYNSVKGGSTVPLKFRVFTGSTQVTSTTGMSVSYSVVACESGILDPVLIEAAPTGGTGLRFDASEGQYIFNWAVPSGAGKCFQVLVTASDGTTLQGAYFKTK
jgi:hypothetical protein